jgi:hypothetical protein
MVFSMTREEAERRASALDASTAGEARAHAVVRQRRSGGDVPGGGG